MDIILSPHAPQPTGPFSQAVQVGGFIFCSGAIGLNPETMTVADSLEAQIHQACANISHVLAAAGAQLQDVVKTTIFMTDMANYGTVNQVYGTYFTHKPARSAIGVKALPLGALVEIEVVAVIN